ncbi:hypothetical protein BGX27_000892 [Mortierella sp. AM989]|nr:hypothetical protein BGX27_000892 [Mortierella sp. AM989]
MDSFNSHRSSSIHSQLNNPCSDISTPLPSLAPERESSTVGSTKKAPGKRSRILIACVNCRFKKTKCDGQTPCSYCEKSKAECVYPIAIKPANHEYVEALENRLRSAESHLQGLVSVRLGDSENTLARTGKSNGHCSRESSRDYSTADNTLSSPATSFAMGTPSSSNAATRNQSHRSSISRTLSVSNSDSANPIIDLTHLTSDNTFGAQESFADDGTICTIHSLMGNLRVDRDGSARYMPDFKGCGEQLFGEAGSYDLKNKSLQHQLPLIPMIVKSDWESVELPRTYALPKNLLSPSVTQELINIYFNSVHTFLPILHKASFLSLCHKGEYKVPPFLLMAICAVASRFTSESERQSLAKLGSMSDHHILFDHARALIDTFIDIPRISTIQGLLLLTFYQIKEMRHGHFFRVRVYLNMAIRMAQDMGLSQDLHKVDKVESAVTGDSTSTNSGTSLSTTVMGPPLEQSKTYDNKKDRTARQSKIMMTASQQERRLAWLGCFFLDVLANSLLGLEYSVVHANLEMRKLIQEANHTSTTQGASLIFWYLHLDLVQIYRRICEMYRFSTTTTQNTSLAMTAVLRGTEILSIGNALESWIEALPLHLVYTRKSNRTTANGDNNIPSYYVLYLHRFYYSLQILLYQPLLASRAHRGDLSKPNSPINKCAIAAQSLTEVGELIFANYSWPWPGCGHFDYHMLQAAEIHIYLVVMHAHTGAKDLYLKTMDLLQGYATLAKLEKLGEGVMNLKQAVENMIITMSTPQRHTSFSILRQAYQHQTIAVMPATLAHPTLQNSSISQPHLNLRPNLIRPTIDPHKFSRLPSASMESQSFSESATISEVLPNMSAKTSLPMSDFEVKRHESPASLYLYSMETMPLSFHDQQQQQQQRQQNIQQYSQQPQQLQQQMMEQRIQHRQQFQYQQRGYDDGESYIYVPSASISDPLSIDDLINLDIHDEQSSQQVSLESDNDKVATLISPAGSSAPTGSRLLIPPPKPPKRILPQSTGSTNSSARSASQRPPVPKKPSWHSDMRAIDPLTPLARHHQQQQQIHQQEQIQESSYSDEESTSSLPLLSSSRHLPPQTKGRRIVRVLKAQSQLYGTGALKNSMNLNGSSRSNTHKGNSQLLDDEHLDLDHYGYPHPRMYLFT